MRATYKVLSQADFPNTIPDLNGLSMLNPHIVKNREQEDTKRAKTGALHTAGLTQSSALPMHVPQVPPGAIPEHRAKSKP